jgi:tRNA (cmo5U34)-methyltransferase
VGQYHWDPDTYLELMHEDVPDYERLEEEAAAATGEGATRLLELGTGTGETARRVLVRHPGATLVGVDASPEMLERARAVLGTAGVELVVGQLEDELPDGRFDLIFSALAVHHLDGPGKADLFRRVADRLSPGGRFVLADLIVPEDDADVVTPIEDPGHDKPSTVGEQLAWLSSAGLDPSVHWRRRDLAVLVAVRPG